MAKRPTLKVVEVNAEVSIQLTPETSITRRVSQKYDGAQLNRRRNKTDGWWKDFTVNSYIRLKGWGDKPVTVVICEVRKING